MVTSWFPHGLRSSGYVVARSEIHLYPCPKSRRHLFVPCLEFEVKKGRTIILPPNCVLVRRDGHESPIEDSAAPIHDRGGDIAGMVVVFHDVSEAQAMAQRMSHLAQHDIITSLPNRALLDDRLEQGIALA